MSMMALIAVLPWAHVGRPRRATVAVSLRGSVLWTMSGFLFSTDPL